MKPCCCLATPLKTEVEYRYRNQQLSIRELADLYQVSRYCVTRWLQHYGIPVWTRSETNRRSWSNAALSVRRVASIKRSLAVRDPRKLRVPPKEELFFLYSTLTCNQIAKLFSVTSPTIQRWLRNCGLARRDRATVNKLVWSNMESRGRRIANILRAVSRRPTKPENRVMAIIKNYKLPFKYTGDGSFIVAGLNPDFVNCNGEKIAIEVFGDFWHNEKAHGQPARTEQGRKRIFGEYGWDLVVLWESKMKSLTDEELAHLISRGSKGEEVI